MLKKKIIFKKVTNTRNIEKKWINWLNNKKLNKFSIKIEKKHTRQTQEIFLNNKISNKKNIIFRVFLDKIFIGVAEIDNILKNQCEIKYMIGDRRYLGKGYGSTLIKKIVDICKNNLEIKKIFAGVINKNFPSIRVLEKNGFIRRDKKSKKININNKNFKIIFFIKQINN